MVLRDRSRPCLIFWEPILNETAYPAAAAAEWVRIVKENAPRGPNLCACDSRARGQEHFDILYGHPEGTADGGFSNLNGRPTFTREWGDCVDDWDSECSVSRIDRAWGEAPQLAQTFHYLQSRGSTATPETNVSLLLGQPPRHFGGALWHSFDQNRGCSVDTFYGGVMTSARIPKTSYWMFKAMLAKPGPKIPNVDLGPFVHVANQLTPASPQEITLFSNVPVADLALFGKPLKEIAPFRYTTEDGRGYCFYDLKALARRGKRKQIAITGTFGGKPFRVPAPTRLDRIDLRLDTMRTDLVADGSELVVAIASLVDPAGTPKHLATERIRFSVEGPAEIVSDEAGSLNPQYTRYGEAVVLLRLGATPGKVTLRAEVDRPTLHITRAATLSFETKPATVPIL